jgi:hypothetical protein
MKDSLISSMFLKEITLQSNNILDEGCVVLNEIFKKSKIEYMNLNSE